MQLAELQRAYDEAMQEFKEILKSEFQNLPVSEEEMKKMMQRAKDKAMTTFKSGVLSGSNFLSTPKGEEFLTMLDKEQDVLTSQI